MFRLEFPIGDCWETPEG